MSVRKEKKIIFGKHTNELSPSWYDRKMMKSITSTLKLDSPTKSENSEKLQEKNMNDCTQEARPDYESLILSDFKREYSTAHKFNLEKLVRQKIRQNVNRMNRL